MIKPKRLAGRWTKYVNCGDVFCVSGKPSGDNARDVDAHKEHEAYLKHWSEDPPGLADRSIGSCTGCEPGR